MDSKPQAPSPSSGRAHAVALNLKKPGATRRVSDDEDEVSFLSLSWRCGGYDRQRMFRYIFFLFTCFLRYATLFLSLFLQNANIKQPDIADSQPHPLDLPRLGDLAAAFSPLPKNLDEFASAFAKASRAPQHAEALLEFLMQYPAADLQRFLTVDLPAMLAIVCHSLMRMPDCLLPTAISVVLTLLGRCYTHSSALHAYPSPTLRRQAYHRAQTRGSRCEITALASIFPNCLNTCLAGFVCCSFFCVWPPPPSSSYPTINFLELYQRCV